MGNLGGEKAWNEASLDLCVHGSYAGGEDKEERLFTGWGQTQVVKVDTTA
ncbi:hypothetical protein [Gloeocapsa sp. PCC 7428]|nr:hypothetical protein [Gloeocapsa sp. PCC 7428]